jgi:hypothetical protein
MQYACSTLKFAHGLSVSHLADVRERNCVFYALTVAHLLIYAWILEQLFHTKVNKSIRGYHVYMQEEARSILPW